MANLQVLNIYDNANQDKIDNFDKKLESSLRIVTDYEKVEKNYEWLDLMEDSVKYIDNILRSPNKFIVNEEDIIKIELAKRVTVESIKHLSRNTNLIQDYDKKTGDVKPSKILNITKEESYDTYENRLIYTLIQKMKYYLNVKKGDLSTNSSLRDNKKIEYSGNTLIGKEKIDINLHLNTNLDSADTKGGNDISKRIEMLEIQIAGLCTNDVYRSIDKLHITLITPPIKKTNVILKNTNFQYAMKLWDYLQTHVDDDTARSKDNKDYQDNGKLKDYFDETFLLDYLTASSLTDSENGVNKEKLSEKLVENMVEKVIDLNNIPLEELQKMVGEKYQIVKYRNVVSDKKIQELFKVCLDKYINKIEEIKI